MNGSGSAAWEAVRRALGRLAGRVVVREMPPESAAPSVAVRVSAALERLPVTPGRREAGWPPQAASWTLDSLLAGPGRREPDLLPAARLAGNGDRSDFALGPAAVGALPVLHAETSQVKEAGLDWPMTGVRLPDTFFALPAAPVRVQSLPLLSAQKRLGANHLLAGWAVRLPKTSRMKIARPATPVVRWGGDSVLDRMPLSRRGLVPPQGQTADAAFAAEHQRLAEALALPPGDVALLGVFPGVPILAVRRILVEDDGHHLRLWLKADVVRARTKLRFITLLVGRQVSTGRMLQAAL